MERRKRFRSTAELCLFLTLLLASLRHLSALSVTVHESECVYEYVLYEGDTVSGNFVVVDHDIFWSSDHPGIDFTVRPFDPSISVRSRVFVIAWILPTPFFWNLELGLLCFECVWFRCFDLWEDKLIRWLWKIKKFAVGCRFYLFFKDLTAIVCDWNRFLFMNFGIWWDFGVRFLWFCKFVDAFWMILRGYYWVRSGFGYGCFSSPIERCTIWLWKCFYVCVVLKPTSRTGQFASEFGQQHQFCWHLLLLIFLLSYPSLWFVIFGQSHASNDIIYWFKWTRCTWGMDISISVCFWVFIDFFNFLFVR